MTGHRCLLMTLSGHSLDYPVKLGCTEKMCLPSPDMERKNIETTAKETHLPAMASAERVVSLLPSATEIVAGLGCASRLVGRSHECDYPSSVESLPVCTRPEAGGVLRNHGRDPAPRRFPIRPRKYGLATGLGGWSMIMATARRELRRYSGLAPDAKGAPGPGPYWAQECFGGLNHV